MGLAVADKLEGPYEFEKEPLTGNATTIEDGYAFREGGKICLLTTHNDAGAGYLWSSDDGIRFEDPIPGFDVMSSYVGPDKLKKAKVIRGRKFERPQVLIKDGGPAYLYLASGANWNGGNGSVSCVFRIRRSLPGEGPQGAE